MLEINYCVIMRKMKRTIVTILAALTFVVKKKKMHYNMPVML